MFRLRSLAVSLALALPLTATSAIGQDDIISERQDAMKAQGGALRTISQMFRGQAAYDSAEMAEAAQTIAASSGQTTVDLFPEGSLSDDSDALPTIWEDPDGFAEIAMALQTAATGLADAATASPSELPSQDAFRAVASQCGACHETYRADTQ